MKRTLLFLIVVAAAAVARTASAGDQLLLPVVTGSDPTPGDQGSMWVTRLWVTNVGSDPVQIFAYCNALCPPTIVPPGGSVFNPAVVSEHVPAALMTVISGDIGNLRVSLRALDLSRQATSAGTEIATIRTSALRTDSIHLVGIPVDSRFRFTLRAYAMATTTLTIRARSMDEPGEPLFFETTATIAKAVNEVPGYVQLDNFLATSSAVAGMRYFRVEVSTLTPVPIWAFMTVTNNDTEQLTTITPY
jgi:hypothetical protein